MMRSIIRFSIDGEANGQLRNLLADILTNAGYVLNPNVTATYENPNITAQQLATTMAQFWQQAGNPPNAAHLDHVWMYSDNPPPVAPVAPLVGAIALAN